MPDEMTIPHAPGLRLTALILIAAALAFSVLAGANLHHHAAQFASCVWLILVGIVIVGGAITEGGPWGLAMALLSGFAEREFVCFTPANAGRRALCFGFEWRQRRFIRRRVPVDRIASVAWSSGQATALSGRDMRDWSVVLWFDRRNPAGSTKKKPRLDLVEVGTAAAKQQTEAFGLSFITFLRAGGVNLVQGDQSTVYVREPEELPIGS